jgi:hypothetical protein
MASYFDLPPQQKAPAAEDKRKELGHMSLLSPTVSQLLDDLGAEGSDSDSEEGSPPEEDTTHQHTPAKQTGERQIYSEKDRAALKPTKSSLSSEHSEKSRIKEDRGRLPVPEAVGGGSVKPRQPHMARFHSLRSMLFSTSIEGKIKTVTQEDSQKEKSATENWREQHRERQMHNRPKTTEIDEQDREHGLGSRLKTRIRRMTSKEVPTMDTLKEDGAVQHFSDHELTTGSDVEEKKPYEWKPRDADESSIDHSDIEDLVRWVSRRDPPSDGEARALNKVPIVTVIDDDSRRESLGDSDVESLVQWVSRKPSSPEKKEVAHNARYSDASTESDSEMADDRDSSDNEDSDDLVRWISRREGLQSGPVRDSPRDDPSAKSEEQQPRENSDFAELGHWVKSNEATSERGSPTRTLQVADDPEEPERGRPRSRDAPPRPTSRNHVTMHDVDELVRWVSRKDVKQQSPLDQAGPVRQQEGTKKKQLGMSNEDNSASDIDLQDLLAHVRSRASPTRNSGPSAQAPFDNTSLAPVPTRPGAAESGVFKRLQTSEREAKKSAAQEHLQKTRRESTQIDEDELPVVGFKNEKKGQKTGRSREEGSLKPEDVDELVKWVSRKS